jgi:chromosome condensin MukBEF MukE localization factor
VSDKPDPKSAKPKDPRAERLAAQLRANLQRRKAQLRARRDGEADARPDGIKAAGDKSDAD